MLPRLVLVLFLACAASAQASTLYAVCGDSLCTVDPETGAKQTLRKGTSGAPYTAVGASTSGKVLAWVRDEEVFRAGGGGKGAQRVGTALRQAAPEVNVRPDGGAIAWIDVVQRLDGDLEPNLLALPRGAGPGDETIVATEMRSAGWLANALLRQAFGSDGAPWFVCVVTAQDGCVRDVAVDGERSLDDPAGSPDGRRVAAVRLEPGDEGAAGPIALYDAASGRRTRTLTSGSDLDPAFSPDGRRVVFVRGRDLFVVPAAGGKARRLARGAVSPAWAMR